jgi:hypothetical protein
MSRPAAVPGQVLGNQPKTAGGGQRARVRGGRGGRHPPVGLELPLRRYERRLQPSQERKCRTVGAITGAGGGRIARSAAETLRFRVGAPSLQIVRYRTSPRGYNPRSNPRPGGFLYPPPAPTALLSGAGAVALELERSCSRVEPRARGPCLRLARRSPEARRERACWWVSQDISWRTDTSGVD